ncbi:MAG: VOC family protein [Rhodoluna sp.]
MIFVNLPVENLKRSVDFFGSLGLTFNPQFTDKTSTCMVISEHIYVMLLEHSKFEGFITKKIAPRDTTEAILSFSCASPEAVKEIAEKAFALGAKQVNDYQDMGFMQSWGFEDLDGHLWDLFYMNPDHVQ